NSTKCFDKVGDKKWKSRLVRHALASKKHRRTEKSFCMGATPLMLFAGSGQAQELLELPHHNLEGVEPGEASLARQKAQGLAFTERDGNPRRLAVLRARCFGPRRRSNNFPAAVGRLLSDRLRLAGSFLQGQHALFKLFHHFTWLQLRWRFFWHGPQSQSRSAPQAGVRLQKDPSKSRSRSGCSETFDGPNRHQGRH